MNDSIEKRIHRIRGQRVILDLDFAEVYGVSVKRLNQQVTRNPRRFPAEFVFRLTAQEVTGLRLQNESAKAGRGGRRNRPLAFAEHGALMAANVLKSRQAEEMSLFVIRAFVKMREHLAARDDLARRLYQIERQLLRHDASLQEVYRDIRALRQNASTAPPSRIGFRRNDESQVP